MVAGVNVSRAMRESMGSGCRLGVGSSGPTSRKPVWRVRKVQGSTDVGWMDDEQIAAALSQVCVVCGVPAGAECVHQTTGKPLLEETGRPVHVRRLDP